MEHGTPRLVVGFLMVLMGLLSLLLITRPGAWKVPLGFALSTVSVGGFVVYHTFIKDILWPWRLWAGSCFGWWWFQCGRWASSSLWTQCSARDHAE